MLNFCKSNLKNIKQQTLWVTNPIPGGVGNSVLPLSCTTWGSLKEKQSSTVLATY